MRDYRMLKSQKKRDELKKEFFNVGERRYNPNAVVELKDESGTLYYKRMNSKRKRLKPFYKKKANKDIRSKRRYVSSGSSYKKHFCLKCMWH